MTNTRKRWKSILAVTLAVMFCVIATFGTSAEVKAATTYTNADRITIETQKVPWYKLAEASVTIKNTGSSNITFQLEDEQGRLKIQAIKLEPNKSATIKLGKKAAIYTLSTGGTMLSGRISASYQITKMKYCDIYN